ncbi:YesL family protein [Neobacillus thermocopriae]|uniref:YesL family protein n=1 Tax=Neobacillus thermocopriae TaxID=1215031 RepID=UPI002E1A1B76|nr:YesL family protein [Neobacillus thermocopriae]MED3715318.1 YesL family protein [Neobacillus thermocopriae]
MKKRSISHLYALTEWISRFAFLNIIWIGFTILGLILFGISPSTVAMFTVIRKWLMGQSDIPIFQTFWGTYKKEFLRSNGLGVVLALLAGIIYLDLYFIKVNASIQIPLYLIIFAIVMTVLYIFPVYVHYNVTFIQLFKNSFFIMLVNPISNILMLIGFVTSFFVIKYIPGLFFFFGGSMTAGLIMATSYTAFQKIEKKQKEAQTI